MTHDEVICLRRMQQSAKLLADMADSVRYLQILLRDISSNESGLKARVSFLSAKETVEKDMTDTATRLVAQVGVVKSNMELWKKRYGGKYKG